MKKSFNKRIVTIIAIIALVAVMAVCLSACNRQEDFEKRLKDKDYVIVSMTAEQLKDMTGEDVGEVEWAIMAMKGGTIADGDYVVVVNFKKSADAKDCANEMSAELPDGFKAVCKGKIVIVGTEQAVKDAE